MIRREWRRLEAIVRSLLNKPHPGAVEVSGDNVHAFVSHVHYWDYCRDYGQYCYRICLTSPDPDNPHKLACVC